MKTCDASVPTDPEPTCTSNGKTYPLGVIFGDTDGLNDCWCTGASTGVCTAVGVDKDAGFAATCRYDGKVYPIGSKFQASDGCNVCDCLWYGRVPCTEMACGSGTVPIDPQSPYDETCVYNGHTYPAGVLFSAADGKKCQCGPAGKLMCTTSL